MRKRAANKKLLEVLLASSLSITVAHAADSAPGIVGKNSWLFYRYEMSEASDASVTDVSLDLIRRFNKVLAFNGVSMAVAMVPLKMRIYSEYLPETIKVSDYMGGNYERMSKTLQAKVDPGNETAV